MTEFRRLVQIGSGSQGVVRYMMSRRPATTIQTAREAGGVVRRYSLLPDDTVEIVDPCSLRLNKRIIAADLHMLPIAEATALMEHATHRSKYDLDALLAGLKGTQSREEMITVVRNFQRSPQPHPYATQLQCPTACTARWLPQGTQLYEDGKKIHLSLLFDVRLKPTVESKRLYPIGIDVGEQPLAAIYYSECDHDLLYRRPTPEHMVNFNNDLGRAGVGEEKLRAVRQAVYAWHREVLESLTNELLTMASHVAIEDIDWSTYPEKSQSPTGGWSPQTQQGKRNWRRRVIRHSGVMDWHKDWLEERLSMAGIPCARVSARGTSRICSDCGRYGVRTKDTFVCPCCGASVNPHINAAHNIQMRGIEMMEAAAQATAVEAEEGQ